jgi:PIN domain nuclease of toxin-antitoxin system
MRMLLDTHVLLWSLLEPERLGADVARKLEDEANELWISPITAWEIHVLAEKGRIDIGREPPGAWLRRVLSETPLREAPVDCEVAIESRLLALPHQDPADRFLAATAKVHGLVLVTADERLLACKGVRTLDASQSGRGTA